MKLKQLRKLIKRELANLNEDSYPAIDAYLLQIEEEYGIEAKNTTIRELDLDET